MKGKVGSQQTVMNTRKLVLRKVGSQSETAVMVDVKRRGQQ